jgi:hypothetical protein
LQIENAQIRQLFEKVENRSILDLVVLQVQTTGREENKAEKNEIC